MSKQGRSTRTRLDRFVSEREGVNRRDVRVMLAAGRITVDGSVARDISRVVDQFTHVSVDGQVLQANNPAYIMLNKPAGVVCATRDARHRTVIDLLHRKTAGSLHIAGRLDFNSTGLVLLTNDGRWSRHLASPAQGVRKVYRVTLENPLTPDYIEAFAGGMYLAYEGITTRPATLDILSAHEADVGLTEGRYHQVKRMFGQFRNRVLTLHRIAIGNLVLDPALAPGESRDLTPRELERIASIPARVP